MADGDYWFARYSPNGRGLVPLNWKGAATIATFVLGLVLGGVLLLIFGLRDQFVLGIPAFVVLAVAGTSFFIWASAAKADPKKSAYEYFTERRTGAVAEGPYWFARRFPVGHPRGSMSPINADGWNVVRRFVSWMIGGALVGLLVAVIGILWVPYLWVVAPFIFAGAAGYAGYAFVAAAQGRGDHQHTVDDYKTGRVK